MNNTAETGWEDVRGAAAEMFNVWEDGAELAWAEEAWGHLHAAGLAGDGTVVGTTAAHLRLVTLARVYQEFCGLVWEETPDTPIEYLAEGLEIDPVALGILAALEDRTLFDEFVDDSELREAALTVVSDGQRTEIFHCLEAACGGSSKLYSRLWHTRSAESGAVDEEDAFDDDGAEFEGTSANSFGLNFVMSGFRDG